MFDVPAGSWEYKVALDGSWAENYGAEGVRNGANLTLTSAGGPVRFTYDHPTRMITGDRGVALGAVRAGQWLRPGLLAWELPAEREGWTFRLHAAASGGLAVEDGSWSAARRTH